MPREEIVLANGRPFKSQKEATEHFRALWARQSINMPIDNPDDQSDLLGLYQRYTDLVIDAKSRRSLDEISHFTARINQQPGHKATNGFWVHFTDGNSSDFSFPAAIRGKGKSRYEDFRDACRRSIDRDVTLYKETYFRNHGDISGRAPSELSGEMIFREQSHVDHDTPSFDEITKTFIAQKGWAKDAIPGGVISEPAENQTTTTFVDQAIADEFRRYHKSAAKLRLISDKENLILAGKAKLGIKRRPA